MFNAIVSQPDEYRNFGFESLTSDERAEYDAWSESVNEGTRDPLPEDFIAYREVLEQDMAKEARLAARSYPVPMDDEQVEEDYDLLIEAGWIERPRPHRVRNGASQILYARVNLKSQILWRDFTATPPRPVKTALDNGSVRYDWGQTFVYFKYDDDARAYRDGIKAKERQAEDARLAQLGARL